MKLAPRDRIWLLLLVAAVLGLSAIGDRAAGQEASGPTRTGMMNLSRVFGEAAAMKRLKAEIDLLFGARIKTLTRSRDALRSDLSRLTPDADPADRQNLLRQLAGVQEQIEKVNHDVDQRKLAFLKGFEGRIRDAAAAAAEAAGVDLVASSTDLDIQGAESAGTLAAAMSQRTFWYASGRVVDLTDDVLRRLDEE